MVYWIVSPAVDTITGCACLLKNTNGSCEGVVVDEDEPVVAVVVVEPEGDTFTVAELVTGDTSLAVAVAVFTMGCAASIWACVTVAVAVHRSDVPGANAEPLGTGKHESAPTKGSVIVTPVSGELPTF